jgi:hypothetical protein
MPTFLPRTISIYPKLIAALNVRIGFEGGCQNQQKGTGARTHVPCVEKLKLGALLQRNQPGADAQRHKDERCTNRTIHIQAQKKRKPIFIFSVGHHVGLHDSMSPGLYGLGHLQILCPSPSVNADYQSINPEMWREFGEAETPPNPSFLPARVCQTGL